MAFKTDLTVLLRLLGNWMVEICSERDGLVTETLGVHGLDAGSTKSNRVPSTLNFCDASATVEATNSRSKTAETLGLALADSTANFLEQLLLLIDRGFVLQRLRDLLALLEIRHNMVSSRAVYPFFSFFIIPSHIFRCIGQTITILMLLSVSSGS